MGLEEGGSPIGIPCPGEIRHTVAVSQIENDPSGNSNRTMFGGAWLRLLGEVQGQPRDLVDFLGHIVRDLGASGVLWLPDSGSAIWTGRYQAKDVDWASLHALQAGVWLAMHQAVGLRRPWGATASGEDWYIRTRPGIRPAGCLRIWFAGPGLGGGDEALDLADSVSGASVLISERKRASQDQQALQLGSRAAGFVHDLRNRLTLVLLQQERFSMEDHGASANSEGQVLLEQARALCASFVPSGDMGLVPQSTLLRPLLVQEARSAAMMARRGSGVAIKVRCPAELQAWVDPVGLVRVLDNLLINAIEASQAGGEVRIQSKRGPRGVQITVEDFGSGMSNEGLQRAYSAGSSGASQTGGTGYGSVSLLSTLAELGGELEVESALGHGTRVQVTLPNPFDTSTPRILIIDPDARRAQSQLRRARRNGQLALTLVDCAGAIRMVGGMKIQQVWLTRGLRDPSLRDLRNLLQSQSIPMLVSSATGLLPVHEFMADESGL
ncbi:MAG: signal transduction histidine kinase [Planctomycetota bacterium]|jgi:signal transduction histidine kinase